MGEVNDFMCDYLGLAKYNADFWNGTVFRGKRKIKVWQLQRHDREYYKTSNRRKAGNVRRDVQLKDLKEENYETSLREIIAVFKRSKDREAMKKYYLENKERFREMDDISIDTMGVLIGKRTLKMFRQKGGGLDMCKAFEDEREEGKIEGAVAMLCNLVKDGVLKMEDAAKRANMSEEGFRKRMQEYG